MQENSERKYKCYSNREENRWRIVTLLKPSTVPTFWHVKDVETNEVFHAAWDMIEEMKEKSNSEVRGGGPLSNENTAEATRRPLH